MMFNKYFFFLLCLYIAIIKVAIAQSPTKSPECNGMYRAKKNLEKGIGTFTKEPINCLVNAPCTGLSCNGTRKNEPFYMSVKLKHCMKVQPEIHLDLIYPKQKLDIHQELKQDSTVDLYSAPLFGKLKLKLNLKRNQNKITSSIDIVGCTKIGPVKSCRKVQTLMPETKFCVDMNTCPKGWFNTTGYAPCRMPSTPSTHKASTPLPTGSHRPASNPPKSSLPSSHTGSPKPSKRPTDHRMSSTKPMTKLHSATAGSPKPSKLPTDHRMSSTKPMTKLHSATAGSPKPSKRPTDHSMSSTKPMTKLHSTTADPLAAKRHSKGDGHHISVGEAVGIGFAVLAVILIVVGVMIYWKKFHHTSRLRAAYYNDISMTDPLYEDFGPEVA